MLRLVTFSRFVIDDTLEVDTNSSDNRIVDVRMTKISLAFRNRLTRETIDSRFVCLSEVTSIDEKLLIVELSPDD